MLHIVLLTTGFESMSILMERTHMNMVLAYLCRQLLEMQTLLSNTKINISYTIIILLLIFEVVLNTLLFTSYC